MTELPETVTVQEQAEAAGKPKAEELDATQLFDAHAKKVIDDAALSPTNRAMALSKLSELVYWLRTK
jgi:hypothetical protein